MKLFTIPKRIIGKKIILIFLMVAQIISARVLKISSGTQLQNSIESFNNSVVLFYKTQGINADRMQQLVDMYLDVSNNARYEEGEVAFLKVNVDQVNVQDLLGQYAIAQFPSIVLFKQGQLVVNQSNQPIILEGFVLRDELASTIDTYLGPLVEDIIKQKRIVIEQVPTEYRYYYSYPYYDFYYPNYWSWPYTSWYWPYSPLFYWNWGYGWGGWHRHSRHGHWWRGHRRHGTWGRSRRFARSIGSRRARGIPASARGVGPRGRRINRAGTVTRPATTAATGTRRGRRTGVTRATGVATTARPAVTTQTPTTARTASTTTRMAVTPRTTAATSAVATRPTTPARSSVATPAPRTSAVRTTTTARATTPRVSRPAVSTGRMVTPRSTPQVSSRVGGGRSFAGSSRGGGAPRSFGGSGRSGGPRGGGGRGGRR